MPRFQIDIVGEAPLMMHNARLSNPLDEVVKKIKEYSSKRSKTDADHETIARLEYMGGLYYMDKVGPYIPGQNIRKALVEGARKNKKGKAIESSVFLTTMINPLVYNGPRTADQLYATSEFVDQASVKVQTSRVMRTRPIFREWATSAEGIFDANIINLEDLRQIGVIAGQYIGLGDYRPLYGRFKANVVEIA